MALVGTTLTLMEDPLSASSLSRVLRALTTLHTKCYLIQQRRLADLMRYVETGDPHFETESNLVIKTITHNSPVEVNFNDLSGIIPGIGILVQRLIDAVSLIRARRRSAELDNDAKSLDNELKRQGILDREQERQQTLLDRELSRRIDEQRAIDEHELHARAMEQREIEDATRGAVLKLLQSLSDSNQGDLPPLADVLRPEFDTFVDIGAADPAA